LANQGRKKIFLPMLLPEAMKWNKQIAEEVAEKMGKNEFLK